MAVCLAYGITHSILALHTGQVSFLSSIVRFIRHGSQHQCMHGWMLTQVTELCKLCAEYSSQWPNL